MKVLLIDGLNLIRRIHAAVPVDSENNAPHEHVQGIINSTTASINRALNQHQPTHCIVAMDSFGPGWRHEIFPEYKKERKPMPEDLKSALPEFKDAFKKLKLSWVEVEGYEADDIIATLAVKISSSNGFVTILSTDRLLCQLLCENVKIYDHFSHQYLTPELARKKYCVDTPLIADVMALAGDSGLSIPGVKSVGIKTASKLVNQYGGLENVLESAASIPGKLGQSIQSGAADARTAYRLFTLKTDVRLGINLNQYRWDG